MVGAEKGFREVSGANREGRRAPEKMRGITSVEGKLPARQGELQIPEEEPMKWNPAKQEVHCNGPESTDTKLFISLGGLWDNKHTI